MSLLLRNPNLYYGVGRRRRIRHRGRGILDVLRGAHDFIKRNKIISTVGNALGGVGVPYAGAIGKAAGILGYGRRRRVGRPRVRRVRMHMGGNALYGYGGDGRRRRRRIGGAINVRGLLMSAHNLAKKHSLVSRALTHLGHPKLASAASALGYGRRRRVVRRRRGGALNVRGLLKTAHDFAKKHSLVSRGLSHLGHHKLASAASALGYGRRRVYRRRRVGGEGLVRRRRQVMRHRGGANFFSTDQIAVPKF